jgi:hypothetical protein
MNLVWGKLDPWCWVFAVLGGAFFVIGCYQIHVGLGNIVVGLLVCTASLSFES